MTTQPALGIEPSPSAARGGLTLLVLTTCVFLVGTAEWVMVGLLPDLAEDLGLPIPTVGSLVTYYALVVTIAGPVVTLLMLRVTRRRALLVLLGVFVGGNVLAAAATGYPTLLAARMITALAHSTTFALALVIAVSLSPPARRGRAIAAVTGGWNLATLLGAPLGTWVGDRYGWRITFWCIAAGSGLVLAAAALVLRPGEPGTAPRPLAELRAMRSRGMAAVLLIIVAAQAGLFTVYTYVAPLLRDVSGFNSVEVTALLTVFGLGALIGNLLGGRLSDRAPWTSLCALLAAFVTVLAAFARTSHGGALTAATVLLLGATAAALIPVVQHLALAAAPAAPTLATAISASAFNLGAAAGSALGAQALGLGFGLGDLSWIGAAVALPALALAVVITSQKETP